MAKGNFAACVAVTLPFEGGYSNHPKDPGKATNRGITIGVLSEELGRKATVADIKALTEARAVSIYERRYWNAVRGNDLPAGVDLATFDYGVNSGPARAAKALQSVVGAPTDGRIGPVTISLCRREEANELVKAVCAKRLTFVRGLKTFSTFGKGWSRRIAAVEAKGVSMALMGYGLKKDQVVKQLAGEAQIAASKAVSQKKAAATTGGGGAGAGGAISLSGDVNWWVVAGILVAVTVIVTLIKSRQNINADRAEAYAKEAAAV